jgi:hypothetical protein
MHPRALIQPGRTTTTLFVAARYFATESDFERGRHCTRVRGRKIRVNVAADRRSAFLRGHNVELDIIGGL